MTRMLGLPHVNPRPNRTISTHDNGPDDVAMTNGSSDSSIRRVGVEPPTLDDVDHQLITLLRADGRVTNRTLAREIGLTEGTIAARIRRLVESNVLAVTAVFDWSAAGYEWFSTGHFVCHDRDPYGAASEICTVTGAIGSSITFGEVDVIGTFLVVDRNDIDRLTADLNRIEGVELVDFNLATNQLKYRWATGTFPINPDPDLVLPNPVVELDDTDHSLIKALVQDARQSNNEIARRLEVSEGTVRSRLKRLTSAGLIRLSAVIDPVVMGNVAAVAFTYVTAKPGALERVGKELAALEECWQLARVVGRYSYELLVVCEDRQQMIDVVMRKIRTLDGVASSKSIEVANVAHHEYHWVHFPNGEEQEA